MCVLISIIRGNKIKQLRLPKQAYGKYWITDYDDINEIKLVSIESLDNNWIISSNDNYTVLENGKEKRSAILRDYTFYLLKNKSNNTYILLYASPIYDTTYMKYSIETAKEITIGKDNNNYIYYNNSGVDKVHGKIINKDNKYIIVDCDSRLGIYVNNKRIYQKKILENGDVIFVAGLKMIFSINNKEAVLIVNNPQDLVKCRLRQLEKTNIKYPLEILDTDDVNVDGRLYKKGNYFYNKYRNIKQINTYTVEIKDKEDNKNIPKQYIYIPMVILILISIILLFNNIILSFIFVIFTIIWPLLIHLYQKNKEEESISNYELYVDNKREEIIHEKDKQKEILLENSSSVGECQKIVLERNNRLWERKKNDIDFLNINLGNTNMSMDIDLTSTIDINKELIMNKVPLTISLRDNKKINLIGSIRINRFLVQQIILQLVTLHRYDDVKIVLFTSDKNKDKWDYVKILPHNFSNNKNIRFFATNNNEIDEVCNYIVRNQKTLDKPYYIIISDNIIDIMKFNLINELLINNEDNISVLFMNEEYTSISKYCDHIINVSDKESIYYENIVNGIKQVFNVDFSTKFNMYECSKILANIPIKIKNYQLPSNYSFLDMFGVESINDLNIYNRWKNNNTEHSLRTIIGIDNNGNNIYLDLHKDYYGSHTLIEGIPGSGKTEFLITYILSMSINYNPYDIQFILMSDNNDLSNIFNNKIPHIVGNVCYEKNELKRFIISFKSELIRRQQIFSATAQKLNEDSVDIYRYQQLFHSKIVDKPIPHLFIVIDEYDKLELNHKEFINKLLKISHIGPTLGIHYVFTTDKKDSTRDIDIFTSKIFMYNLNNYNKIVNHPGEFYLMDNNEKIILGKTGTSEALYKNKHNVDSSINFVNNIGRTIKKVNRIVLNEKIDIHNTEIKNILDYMISFSNKENINIKKLFLNKLSEYNTIANIINKYEVTFNHTLIEPIIGEYEDLVNHVHNILRVNMNNGNTVIYGINQTECEQVISSILFSSMYLYNPLDINYYIIDYGTNLLSSFKKSNLIGDIVLESNTKKIENLFKIIKNTILERKKLFKEYNNYNDYIKNSSEKVPLITIIINNFSLFNISNKNYLEDIIYLLDNNDYGIHLLLSSSELLPYEIIDKFNNIYALEQLDYKSYYNIFNERITNSIESLYGRGLTRINNVICEFQTSFATPKNRDFNTFIENQCIECSKEYKNEAKDIPVLPDKLTFKQVKHELGKTHEMIIGYDTSLNIIKYNLNSNNLTTISGLNMNIISKFTNPFIKQVAYLNKHEVIVIDASENGVGNNINNLKYISSEFNNSILSLEEYINNIASINTSFDVSKNLCIFINGLTSLYNKLTDANKLVLNDILIKTKIISNINIIIIDSYEEIKKYKDYIWYKELFNSNEGIWIGSGVVIQDIFNINKTVDNNIEDNNCYLISNGIPMLIQYVESFDILEK